MPNEPERVLNETVEEIRPAVLFQKKEESRPARARAQSTSKKKRSAPEGEIWMHWKGDPGQHTPPLPSHDLTQAYVEVHVSSMEEAEEYERTGLWELKIPDGGLRKTRPSVESEG